MAPLVRRSWSLFGQTPVMHQKTRSHQKVSMIVALSVSPMKERLRLFFRLHPGQNINSELAIDFLKNLLRQINSPIVLVWDRLNVHRSGKTQDFIEKSRRIKAYFLPPYAPELNPPEYFNGYLKYNPLANRPMDSLEEMVMVTRRHSRSIARRQPLLRSFMKHSPLPLKLTMPDNLNEDQ